MLGEAKPFGVAFFTVSRSEAAADEPAVGEPAADEPTADKPAADEPAADGDRNGPRAMPTLSPLPRTAAPDFQTTDLAV